MKSTWRKKIPMSLTAARSPRLFLPPLRAAPRRSNSWSRQLCGSRRRSPQVRPRLQRSRAPRRSQVTERQRRGALDHREAEFVKRCAGAARQGKIFLGAITASAEPITNNRYGVSNRAWAPFVPGHSKPVHGAVKKRRPLILSSSIPTGGNCIHGKAGYSVYWTMGGRFPGGIGPEDSRVELPGVGVVLLGRSFRGAAGTDGRRLLPEKT